MQKLESGKYEISREELVSFLYAENKLNALERGGVDNWEWYGEEQWQDRDEIENDLI